MSYVVIICWDFLIEAIPTCTDNKYSILYLKLFSHNYILLLSVFISEIIMVKSIRFQVVCRGVKVHD